MRPSGWLTSPVRAFAAPYARSCSLAGATQRDACQKSVLMSHNFQVCSMSLAMPLLPVSSSIHLHAVQ
jgi:hypothetical protein